MATSKGKSKVLFDYTKPVLHGYLYKQGGLHKAFKKRYFVLYPGYLVYYSDETKYHTDVAKGSLQGRLHAVRIKGGECHHAKEIRDAPRGCKFGFTISAPDPINRRNTYLLNAASREERRLWLEAIKTCCQETNTNRQQVGAASNGRNADTVESEPSVEPSVAPKNSDQANSDSSGSESGTFARTSPNLTNYPNSIRRETGVAAALMPLSNNDEDNDACITSFGGPYADSEDDIGPDPELCVENEPSSSVKNDVEMISNGVPASGKEEPTNMINVIESVYSVTLSSAPITSEPDVSASAVVTDRKSDEKISDAAKLTQATVLLSAAAVSTATTSDHLPTAAVNSTSEESEDLPVGGHSGNPSDSGTTSDDDIDDDVVNLPGPTTKEQTEDQPAIKVINPSVQKKSPLTTSSSSPLLGAAAGQEVPKPRQPTRRTSAPFLQKMGYLHKQGGRRPTWKFRYFVLTPGMFTYYKNDMQRNKPIGEVKLKSSSVHVPKPGESKEYDYQFVVHTESQWNKRSNYVFAANSEPEMKSWIDAFKAAGQKVVMQAPTIGQAEIPSDAAR